MQEKRKHPRFKVSVMDMRGRMLFSSAVIVPDISLGGIALKTLRRLHVGKNYTLMMQGYEAGKVLSLKGTVEWSRLSEKLKSSKGKLLPVYRTGMRFTDITESQMTELHNFINHRAQAPNEELTAYKLNGVRMHVRFRVEPPAKALLNIREEYLIKNLSLSGMLIESEESLETGLKLPMEIIRTKKKTIRFTGRIVTCNLIRKNKQSIYEIGIEFQDLTEKNKELLKEVICLAENMGFISI
jgi:hypothetical protein